MFFLASSPWSCGSPSLVAIYLMPQLGHGAVLTFILTCTTRALHYLLPVLVGTLPIGIPMEKTPGTDPRFFSLLSEFTPVQKTFAT
jgi:hypothetical protein